MPTSAKGRWPVNKKYLTSVSPGLGRDFRPASCSFTIFTICSSLNRSLTPHGPGSSLLPLLLILMVESLDDRSYVRCRTVFIPFHVRSSHVCGFLQLMFIRFQQFFLRSNEN
jgi:hypothetical protein